jgi:hypothetical protein
LGINLSITARQLFPPQSFLFLTGFGLELGKALGVFHVGRDGECHRIAFPDEVFVEEGAVLQVGVGKRTFVTIGPADVILEANGFAEEEPFEIGFCFFAVVADIFVARFPGFRCIDTDQADFFLFSIGPFDPKGIPVDNFGDREELAYSTSRFTDVRPQGIREFN